MNTAIVVSAMLSLVGSPVHQQTPISSVPAMRLSLVISAVSEAPSRPRRA
ncbi:MAG: hypothetical protein RLZZ395_2321, partial [Pseudomonadota bacterium]